MMTNVEDKSKVCTLLFIYHNWGGCITKKPLCWVRSKLPSHCPLADICKR